MRERPPWRKAVVSIMDSNVPLDLAIPLKSIEHPLHDSIRELRQGYQSLSDCVEQAMAECDQRGSELADCRRQLAEARRSLMEQEKDLSERAKAESEASKRCAALKKQLETAQGELGKANEKLVHLQADEMQSTQRLELQVEHNRQLQQQIERLQTDDDQSRQELSQLRAQSAPLTEATVDAARLRAELVAAQAELATTREQLAAKSDQANVAEQLSAALARAPTTRSRARPAAPPSRRTLRRPGRPEASGHGRT